MNLFKQKNSNLKNSGKLKFTKNSFFSKKRVLPFVVIFGLLGGYLVFRSFAYTPKLNGAAGEYVALTPARIMDTRDGNGGYKAPISVNGTYSLLVAGRGGIPDVKGQTAVVLNVVAVGPTAAGSMTVWPSGTTKTTATTINYAAAQTIANQVTVPLGADGKVQISSTSSAHIVVDVAGYYSSETGLRGGRYQSLNPARLVDTRNGTGGRNTTLTGGTSMSIQINGVAGVPTSGATSVVVNLVPVSPTKSGYATMWPSGITMPTASSVNFETGKTLAKLVTVPIGADGKIQLYTHTTSHYVVDIAGYYSLTDSVDSNTQAGRYKTSKSSYNVFDTVSGLAPYPMTGRRTAFTAKETVTVPVSSACGLPVTNVRAVVLNVTSTKSTAGGYLSIWPYGTAQPTTSVLNYMTGQTISNQVIAKVGTDGKINIYAHTPSHVVISISGCFIDKEDDYGVFSDFSTGIIKNDISQLERSITIDSVPANSNIQINMGLSLSKMLTGNGGSVNYGSAASPSLRVHGTKGDVTFNCWIEEKCKPLVVNSQDVSTSSSMYRTKIPFNFTTGTYNLKQTVLVDSAGYPGTWIKHSLINPSGVATDLLMSFSDSKISFTNSGIFTDIREYSCESTTPISFSFGAMLADGAPLPVETKRMWMRTFGSNCPGYSKVEYNNTALDTSPKDLFKLTFDIPKSQRDINPPVISDFSWDNTSKSLKLTATEDNLISQCFLVAAGYGYSCPTQTNVIDSTTVLYYGLVTGVNEASVDITDNSGNKTSQLIQFTNQ
ncbi:MAG: hypothetical protein Q7T41_03335 [Candidatus Saccharibacteria bacterium]|nr:hypothetical protein [Candidatus Saccharibacteria bacterium]